MKNLFVFAWLALLAPLVGCRDSPAEVIAEASGAAAEGRLVEVQEAFSITTVQRLERAWKLNRVRPEEGWGELSKKLVFDGKPIEVLREDIREDFAQVWTRAGATERDYYLRKEDGRWRIELGGGQNFERAKARVEAEKKKDEKDDKDSKDDKKADDVPSQVEVGG